MAKRNENECAFCAEEVEHENAIIGQDWKVYCSSACTRRGEDLSLRETSQLMRHLSDRHWPAATVKIAVSHQT